MPSESPRLCDHMVCGGECQSPEPTPGVSSLATGEQTLSPSAECGCEPIQAGRQQEQAIVLGVLPTVLPAEGWGKPAEQGRAGAGGVALDREEGPEETAGSGDSVRFPRKASGSGTP